MDEVKANFLKKSACIICDTCEMGCGDMENADCVQGTNPQCCGIVKEAQVHMLQLFCETAQNIFINNLLGGSKN